MFCERCTEKMVHKYSFSAKGNYEWYQCPRCGFETVKVPVFSNVHYSEQNAGFVKNYKHK